MSDRPAAEILVDGEVQGVGYRAFVERRARRLGLVGWVKNLRDGRVEVHVEGDRMVIEELIRDLKQGPRLARVTGTTIRWLPASDDLRTFEVRSA